MNDEKDTTTHTETKVSPTPGPWIAIDYSVFATDGSGHVTSGVAWTAGNARTRTPEAKANAHLIAAAPDLLEAAKLVCCGASSDTLKAAIAKAEGKG